MLRATWFTLCLLFIGCGETQNEGPPPLADSAVESETPAVDPNSMQAQQDAQRARELHPGKAHYDRACTSCHGGAVQKAPHREMLGLMTPEAILATMTTGVMQAEAAALSESERVAVAEYLAASPLGEEIAEIPACATPVDFDGSAATLASNWGLSHGNGRNIDAASSALSGADFESLEPKWAISLPGANRARSQPAFAGGLLFVGAHNGKVYALDQDTGCRVWAHRAAGEVRTGIVVGPPDPSSGTRRLFFGDVLGNVYAVDASSGDLLWRTRADDHPNATITGTPTLHEDKLYVPISALEVSLAIDPAYACCTFRGSVLALDAATGDESWRTYTIAEAPRVQKQTEAGTDVIGPSGAVIWNSPSIDVRRNQLYVGTGENMSSPATTTSDALFAMDLDTGAVNWVFQATPMDAWNVACGTDTPQNCPDENGPDYDFGAATILASGSQAGDLLIGGQKSGFVHALDPDTGELVWQTRVGRGGIQGGIHFGMAVAGDRLLVPVSDMLDGRTYDMPARPGMHALDINTGAILWSTIHTDACEGRRFCHPGISQAPTVINDVVVAGAMDGLARAYDIETGAVRWQLDTTQQFATTDGGTTSGGSFGGAAGPIAFNGLLVLSSGYGIYNHMPGNLLLVMSKPATAREP